MVSNCSQIGVIVSKRVSNWSHTKNDRKMTQKKLVGNWCQISVIVSKRVSNWSQCKNDRKMIQQKW